MRRRWVVLAAAALGLVIAIPIAVIAFGTDPAKVVVISASEARSLVVQFVARADWTADLRVSGPNEGAYMRYYDVAGEALSASVNAHDGTITTLFMPGNRRLGMKATTTQDAAARTADEFLAMHEIDISGLDRTVSLLDNGDTSAWTVMWQGHEGAVTVPRYFEVDVDAASGLVFGYASINRPYIVPGTPEISQADAVQAARTVSALSQVDSVELRIAFTESGTQYLVYDIRLSGTVPGQPASLRVHAKVQVDANTGEAEVVAVG